MLQWREMIGAQIPEISSSGKHKGLIKYKCEAIWSNELIDSGTFSSSNQLFFQNPSSFGFVQPGHMASQGIKVGAFEFDKQFIMDQLLPKGLTPISNIKEHFPLGFTAPVDYKGKWQISESGTFLERKAHPGRETIGDMKVFFEALVDDLTYNRSNDNGNFTGNDRMLISAIGVQKSKTLINDSNLILRLGSYSLKKLLLLEEQEILNSRFNTRIVLITCIFLFQYGLFHDIKNVMVYLPLPWNASYNFGWFVSSMLISAFGSSVVLSITKLLYALL